MSPSVETDREKKSTVPDANTAPSGIRTLDK